MKKNNKKTYETVIRGKWIYGKSTSFDQMIAALNSAAKELAEMRDAGCKLNPDGSPDDYFFVTTDDKEVAKKFGLELAE